MATNFLTTSMGRLTIITLGVLLIIYLVIRILLEYAVFYFDRHTPTAQITDLTTHQHNVAQAKQQLVNSHQRISLASDTTTHLFGLRQLSTPNKLDLSKFNSIIEINESQGYIRVGGKANLYGVLEVLNGRGYSLKVVPDMDHLTIGGLYSGVGGGATTFKHGAFYCTVRQIEVVTGNGEIILANANQHRDLFRLMPCSLGSLGYVLSFWLEIEPIHRYVYSETQHYRTYPEYLVAIEQAMTQRLDFLDGTIFSPTEFVLITGKITDHLDPSLPHYGTRLDIPYYSRVRQGYRGFFSYHSYVYRWDVDGYYSMWDNSWELRLFRQLWFRRMFFDHRLMRESRLRAIFKPFITGMNGTSHQIKADVGDFMLPRSRSEEFYQWYDQEIGLYPLYICPITFTRDSPFIQCDRNAIDFGVGYGVTQNQMKSETLLRKCMYKTYQLQGDMLKYISVYRNPEEFWSFYPKALRIEYESVKRQYDRRDLFPSVAEKLSRR